MTSALPPGALWHPFADMSAVAGHEFTLARGEGAVVTADRAVSVGLADRVASLEDVVRSLANGYRPDGARAEADLAADRGDLVAFGRPFIANPDLVRRIRAGLPLAAPDAATFYTPGEKGYIDYPLAEAA